MEERLQKFFEHGKHLKEEILKEMPEWKDQMEKDCHQFEEMMKKFHESGDPKEIEEFLKVKMEGFKQQVETLKKEGKEKAAHLVEKLGHDIEEMVKHMKGHDHHHGHDEN